MGRVTQFGVNADLVQLGGDACVEDCPDASLAVDAEPLDPARLATKMCSARFFTKLDLAT